MTNSQPYRKMTSIYAMTGVIISLVLAITLEFVSPETPDWYYAAILCLNTISGYILGRLADSKYKSIRDLQEKLSVSNNELQKQVDDSKWMVDVQKEIEKKIGNAKRTWELIFDAVSDVIVLTDQNDVILRCNNAAIKAINETYLTLLGQKFSEVYTDMNGNPPVINQTLRLQKLPGYYYITASQVTLDNAETGIIYIIRDITEQTKSSPEMIGQREYLEALVSNTPDALLILDNQQKIFACNSAFTRLFGYKPREIVGKNVDPMITSSEHLDEAKKLMESLAEGVKIHYSAIRNKNNGKRIMVEIFGIPVRAGNRSIGSFLLFRDMSDLPQSGAASEDGRLESSPIDMLTALPRFSNDVGFFKTVLNEFIADLPWRINSLEKALLGNNNDGIIRIANSLKATSANFSAEDLMRLAEKIETQVTAKSLEGIPDMINRMKFEVGRLIRFYQSIED
ncbi:MAG: hypothetical protein C0391_04000 [Anaerolinea sp.]|nr:hypothetical protein [Anaerolinea sp.]